MTKQSAEGQTPSLRALALQSIEFGGAVGVTDEMCLSVVTATYPDVGMERIHTEFDSLEADGLVTLVRRENWPLRAQLTQRGRDMAADSQTSSP